MAEAREMFGEDPLCQWVEMLKLQVCKGVQVGSPTRIAYVFVFLWEEAWPEVPPGCGRPTLFGSSPLLSH